MDASRIKPPDHDGEALCCEMGHQIWRYPRSLPDQNRRNEDIEVETKVRDDEEGDTGDFGVEREMEIMSEAAAIEWDIETQTNEPYNEEYNRP